MNVTIKDQMFATLAGGAIGDAFGYRIEFQSLAAIRSRFGPAGLIEPIFDGQGRLIVSDDTQLALFTAEGIVDALEKNSDSSIDEVNAAIREAYLRWYETQANGAAPKATSRGLSSFSEMYARRAPGNTCLSALAAGGQGTPANPVNSSKGCGGVMRVAPLGLVETWGVQRAIEAGALAAAITHGHPSGYWSAGFLSGLVREAMDGATLQDATPQVIGRLVGLRGAGEVVDAVEMAVRYSEEEYSPEVLERKLGGGWVGEEALAIGLYACLRATQFTEALQIAANHSGDSDSTASIAGQIWGAFHGSHGIPVFWVNALDVLRPLQSTLDQLTMSVSANS